MGDTNRDEERAIGSEPTRNEGRGAEPTSGEGGGPTPGVTQGTPEPTEKIHRPTKERTTTRLKRHLTVEVSTKWADLLLIKCFFISGLVDSVAFNVWSCFASMQTGNTIFVGLGVSDQPGNGAPFGWTKSLTAILCFCIGALFFSTCHRLLGPIRRWVLISSFSLQTLLIVIAAILVTTGMVSNRPNTDKDHSSGASYFEIRVDDINWKDLAPLALLAFQSSGQVVASRMLKYNELPTVVLTSLYCDLMSDAHLLTAGIRDDAKRNRRAVAAVTLFVGAVSGGFLTKSWVGMAGALWIAAFLKGVTVVAWFFWAPAAKVEEVL